MKALFLRKKSVPLELEYVLNRSRSERCRTRSNKMKALFLRKKSVPSQVECVLNRSISERFPFFWERYFFLKIGHSLFWNAFFTVLFDSYFSLGKRTLLFFKIVLRIPLNFGDW
jgi:hypothetical protein